MDIFGWRGELTVARTIEARVKRETEVYSENKKQANKFKRVWEVVANGPRGQYIQRLADEPRWRAGHQA